MTNLMSMSADSSAFMSQMLLLGVMFVLLYFVMIRPQRKRDKETQAMRNSVEIGDEVLTIGGIVGLVVSVKDDTIVIETSGDRSKIRIQRWGVHSKIAVREDS